MSFFGDHIVETYTTVVVALLGIVGTISMDSVKSEVRDLECSVSTVAVGTTYEKIELSLLGRTIDDLLVESDQIKTLGNIEEDFEKSLSLCKKGKRQLGWVVALRDGLTKYANKNYRSSIEDFNKLDQTSSLSQYLLAAAKFHLLDVKIAKPEEINQLKSEIHAHLESSRRLATEMPVSVATFQTLTRLKCAALMVNRDTNSNNEAISCLEEIIKNKDDDHNTYYNLAAIYAREHRSGESIKSLELAFEHGGTGHISKQEIQSDDDFKNLFSDKSQSQKLSSVLDKFTKK